MLRSAGLFRFGGRMQRQFFTAIAGAVVAWWIIERLKEMKAEKATVDPVAGLAASEANSEIMV